MVPGGWQIHDSISAEHMDMFNAIKPNLTNGEYIPISVGTMLLGSTTVCFICKTTGKDDKEFFSKVMVQVPIGEAPKFQSAREIFI